MSSNYNSDILSTNKLKVYTGPTNFNYTLSAPDDLIDNYTLYLPPDNTNNRILSTNGNGILGWNELTYITGPTGPTGPDVTGPTGPIGEIVTGPTGPDGQTDTTTYTIIYGGAIRGPTIYTGTGGTALTTTLTVYTYDSLTYGNGISLSGDSRALIVGFDGNYIIKVTAQLSVDDWGGTMEIYKLSGAVETLLVSISEGTSSGVGPVVISTSYILPLLATEGIIVKFKRNSAVSGTLLSYYTCMYSTNLKST
jgi:hypothetical protein